MEFLTMENNTPTSDVEEPADDSESTKAKPEAPAREGGAQAVEKITPAAASKNPDAVRKASPAARKAPVAEKASVEDRKAAALRNGVAIFILLAFMTVGEYLIGAYVVGWAAPLAFIAILKAALIVRDYMHLPRLFSGDEEAHE
jgi:hypothetical protein